MQPNLATWWVPFPNRNPSRPASSTQQPTNTWQPSDESVAVTGCQTSHDPTRFASTSAFSNGLNVEF